jgi:hypothetical protein
MTLAEFWLAVISVCLIVIVVELSDILRMLRQCIPVQREANSQTPAQTYGGWKLYKNRGK